MTYIAPQGIIRLYSDIPFDTGYRNQTKFASLYAQSSYFEEHIAHTLTEQSYQRETKGTMKVSLTVTELLGCNYLSFNNGNGFSNKTYYCFITDIEYVNNATTLIRYSLDYIQSFQFDYTIKQCMVEREHVLVDNVGDYTLDENLPVGELKTVSTATHSMGDTMYLIHTTYDADRQLKFGGSVHNGITYAGQLMAFSSMSDFSSALKDITDVDEGYVVGTFTAPSKVVGAMTGLPNIVDSTQYSQPDNDGLQGTKLTSFWGYAPNNKKLLCYPYYQIELTNNSGETVSLMPERFTADNNMWTFAIFWALNDATSTLCFPTNYNGMVHDYNHGITLRPYPSVQFAGNPLASYFNQNSGQLIASGVKSIVGGSVGGALSGARAMGSLSNNPALGGSGGAWYQANSTDLMYGAVGGGVAGGALALANTGLNIWAKYHDLSNTPPSIHNSLPSNAILSNLHIAGNTNANTFQVIHKAVNIERLVTFDNYLSKFGYKVNSVKVPNINTRPHWNYVKTDGATVESTLPYDIEDKICGILDNGITFWKNPDEVGNYNLNNDPGD